MLVFPQVFRFFQQIILPHNKHRLGEWLETISDALEHKGHYFCL